MSRVFNVDEIASTLIDILEKSEEISVKVNTNNMLPLFKKDRDVATIVKIEKSLKQNDVVLYKKEDGTLSFSRVMFFNGDNFVLCGDSNSDFEYNVKREQILALVVSFDKKGKTYKLADNAYVKALPVIKEIRKYSIELGNRTKDFIKFLKKR